MCLIVAARCEVVHMCTYACAETTEINEITERPKYHMGLPTKTWTQVPKK